MYAAMQRSLDERRQIPSICLYVRALRRRALWAACGAAARARGGEAVLRGDRVPSLEHLERREGPWAAVVAAAGAAAGTLPEIGPPLTRGHSHPMFQWCFLYRASISFTSKLYWL